MFSELTIKAFQYSFGELLQSARESEVLNYDTVSIAVNKIFSTGEYHKTSSDLLQLVCGHRADVFQMRRDGSTKYVKDPHVKSTLQRTPSSCTNLFDAESFTTAIEKAGDVRKYFCPLQRSHKVSASLAITRSHVPPQGSVPRRIPLHGSNLRDAHEFGFVPARCCNNSPPQGGCKHNYPTQGHSRQLYAPNNQRLFHDPTFIHGDQFKSGRKRASSSSRYTTRSNKKRK